MNKTSQEMHTLITTKQKTQHDQMKSTEETKFDFLLKQHRHFASITSTC